MIEDIYLCDKMELTDTSSDQEFHAWGTLIVMSYLAIM